MTESRQALDTPNLIALGREVVETITTSRFGEFEVMGDRIVNLGHLPMVHAYSRHTLRLGTVVLDLYDRGLYLEAVPTIRSAYECALTACWMAESREAPTAAYNEEQRQRRLLSNTMAKAVNQTFSQGANEVSLGDPERIDSAANPQARSVEQLCSALSPGGPDAYVVYRILSAFSHASISLADQYVQAAPGAAAGARLLVDPNELDEDRGRT